MNTQLRDYGKIIECAKEFREAAEHGEVIDPPEIVRIFRMYLKNTELSWLCEDLPEQARKAIDAMEVK